MKLENLPEELKKFGVGCFNNKSKTIKNLIEKNPNLSKQHSLPGHLDVMMNTPRIY